jgi:hypothetical protein
MTPLVTVMRIPLNVAFLFGIANAGLAGCGCPTSALSSRLLVTVPAEGRGGVVACGYEESRRGKVIRASEFQVFRCEGSEEVLNLSAVHSATLEAVGDVVRVVEIAHWPFGEHWQLVEIPVAEWLIDSHFRLHQAPPRPRLPKPRVTRREVKQFLREYQAWLAKPDRDYANAEDLVGRLFAAMASGDGEAGRLFLSMRSDAGLDGAALEDHALATYDYRIGRKQ